MNKKWFFSAMKFVAVWVIGMILEFYFPGRILRIVNSCITLLLVGYLILSSLIKYPRKKMIQRHPFNAY